MNLTILLPSKTEPKIMETLMAVEEWFPDAQVIIANDRYGQGKGWAVREALSEAKGEVVIFLDADMDIHPKMIWRLLPFIDDYDIVVGKKEIKGLWSRRIITFLSRMYIRLFFGITVDSQTGVKVFKRDAIFEWKTNSFAFDIEILLQAKRNGKRMIEVPVDAKITRKMKMASVWKCFTESLKILVQSFPVS